MHGRTVTHTSSFMSLVRMLKILGSSTALGTMLEHESFHLVSQQPVKEISSHFSGEERGSEMVGNLPQVTKQWRG